MGPTARIVLAYRAAVLQVVLGVVMGAAFIGVMLQLASAGLVTPTVWAILAGYTLFMLAVCLLACVVPTRRALRVEPMEALRAD